MARRLLIVWLTLCALVVVHAPAWAAPVSTPAAAPVLLTPEQETAIMLVQNRTIRVSGAPSVGTATWLWSIVPGVGQLFMGETPSGLAFLLGFFVGVPVLTYLTTQAVPSLAPSAWTMGGVLGGLVWAWNLWDAYALNMRLLQTSAIPHEHLEDDTVPVLGVSIGLSF